MDKEKRVIEIPETDNPMSEAVRWAYKNGEDDELMDPIVLTDKNGQRVGRIAPGDYVIFYDIRGEREIELTQAFVDKNFSHFPVEAQGKVHFATMIEYHSDLNVKVAFPPQEHLKNSLVEVVNNAGMKVAKVAETEKAVHVNYFLSGKRMEVFPKEVRDHVESDKTVKLFSEKPEMSVYEVAEKALKYISDPEAGLIVTNFANTDVLGHIENKEAILAGVGHVDKNLGRLVEAARKNGVTTIVTADHGSAEKWLYPEGTIDTGHTTSPVPFIIIPPEGEDASQIILHETGELTDVAPTILSLLGLPIPSEMTGKNLIKFPANFHVKNKRVLLMICDGWGCADPGPGNLISQAETPNMSRYMKEFPFICIAASGEAVGLPEGTVGNSEAGHLHLGAGRRVYSDRLQIERAIKDGSFDQNEAFCWAMDGSIRDNTCLHLLGIISFFSSHGSIEHLIQLMHMAKKRGVKRVYIHGLLGRRGERPESGARYTKKIEDEAKELGLGEVVTIIGRYWALDREHNWDRIEKTYQALVYGTGRIVMK